MKQQEFTEKEQHKGEPEATGARALAEPPRAKASLPSLLGAVATAAFPFCIPNSVFSSSSTGVGTTAYVILHPQQTAQYLPNYVCNKDTRKIVLWPHFKCKNANL